MTPGDMLTVMRRFALYFKGMFDLCQDHGVTCAVMATMGIQQDGLDQFGYAFLATVIRMLILMLLVTATEPLESA
jgi:hypothetical protein